ncbi:MAG: glycine dehydrogenase (aminomethyl-transferring), partial [Saprospiraceae bacterium]|nr:glycine dehydrogenase (aminomethyl-transferring) [Saprospiraceae bacterium]
MGNIRRHPDHFKSRHIGISKTEKNEMLEEIGVEDLSTLINQTIPSNIRSQSDLNIPDSLSEFKYLKEIAETASMNQVFRSYIGQGYYGTITPPVIARNIFQNPGWYTQYTPYQAE